MTCEQLTMRPNKAAAGDGNLAPAVERLRFFSEVLKWHADGEDELVFPATDRVAPLVAQAYLHDHNEFDTMTGKCGPGS